MDIRKYLLQFCPVCHNKEKINIREFDLWIIDVQGSELPVIKGSQNSLKFCKYLVTEISKKEFYKGGTKWIDLLQWLRENKFEMIFEPEKDHDNATLKMFQFKSTHIRG